jgi:hypothetical protein
MPHLTLLAIVVVDVITTLIGPTGLLAVVAQETMPGTLAGTPTPFTGETFVGRTSDPDTFVAVVVAEPAGDGGERQARVYLCNATTIDVWLTGTLTGDQLDLRAEDEAWLEATLSEQGVEGNATLADGAMLSFTAQPATAFAGPYTATIDAEGQLRGASSSGEELAGRVEPTPGFRIVMTVTAREAEGLTTQTEATATVAEEGTFRLIVLEDGQARGRGKTKDGQGYIDPTTDI